MTNRILQQERRLERLRKQACQDMALATNHDQMVHAMNRLMSTARQMDNLAHAA